MAATHGSKAGLKIGSTATPGTADKDLTVYANSIGSHFTRDSAETSTLGKTSKTFIPGLKDATLPFAGPFDTAADPLLQDVYDSGVIFNWEYAPAGIGTVGTPLYTGTAFCTSYQITSPVGGVSTISAEFKVTGDVTRTVQ